MSEEMKWAWDRRVSERKREKTVESIGMEMENMDLASRAEETSTRRISKDDEQPPITVLTEVMVSADTYACTSVMYAYYILCVHVCLREQGIKI